jgi:hypothetical protein
VPVSSRLQFVVSRRVVDSAKCHIQSVMIVKWTAGIISGEAEEVGTGASAALR